MYGIQEMIEIKFITKEKLTETVKCMFNLLRHFLYRFDCRPNIYYIQFKDNNILSLL